MRQKTQNAVDIRGANFALLIMYQCRVKAIAELKLVSHTRRLNNLRKRSSCEGAPYPQSMSATLLHQFQHQMCRCVPSSRVHSCSPDNLILRNRKVYTSVNCGDVNTIVVHHDIPCLHIGLSSFGSQVLTCFRCHLTSSNKLLCGTINSRVFSSYSMNKKSRDRVGIEIGEYVL